MKSFLGLVLLIWANIAIANAPYLPYCFNSSSNEISFSFVSCVNSNFSTLDREYGLYLPYCHQFGDGLPYSFISCVNSNFSTVARKLNIYLPSCHHYGPDGWYVSYVSCVNGNFSRISR